MQVSIKYAGFCLKGEVRLKNEDNLWYPRGCLPMEHGNLEVFDGSILASSDGLPGPGRSSGNFESISGAVPAGAGRDIADFKATSGAAPAEPDGGPGKAEAFAVFDGMGGAAAGEAASYLAAAEFGRWAGRSSGLRRGEENAICRAMNQAVLTYAKAHRATGMGATVVSLCFDEAGAYGFNIGDSRCLHFSEGRLYALSTDHAIVSPVTRRARLTQCLGIPETEFVLEPAVFSVGYRIGDIFLICSDGLTSMVGPVRISGVLSAEATLVEKLEALREMVFRRGAEDNVTIILFEICEAPAKAGEKAV